MSELTFEQLRELTKGDNIRTREEFIKFVHGLLDEFQNNRAGWQNDTVDSYLGALAGWVEDMDGAYMNRGEKMPEDIKWDVFAKALAAASVYD